MPVTAIKNSLYRAALPFFGLRTGGHASCDAALPANALEPLLKIFRRHHLVGGCMQLVKNGVPDAVVTYGFSRLPGEKATERTLYRTASITKMVTAVGLMALCEKGIVDIDAPAENYLGFPVRNPAFPDSPILVRHLLSHTSGLWDGPGYEQSLFSPISLKEMLGDPRNYLNTAPGEAFRYCNLAAGMAGSVMECADGRSIAHIMRELVFERLSMNAAYTLKDLPDPLLVADIYRVLPRNGGHPAFPVKKRLQTADDLTNPDPLYHYRLAAGNLFTDAPSLGRLVGALASGGEPVLKPETLQKMQTPVKPYGKGAPHASHCLGLVMMDDPSLPVGRLYGHQGFAYGAAEGVFYDPGTGNGFVFLNNGASEARNGHLAWINRDLILWAFGKGGPLSGK